MIDDRQDMTTSDAAVTAASSTDHPSDALLRVALKLDAVVTGVNGVAYLVAAALLEDVLGLGIGLLRGIGVFLLLYGVAVWIIGTRPTVSTAAVAAVIAANTLWAAGSVAVVLTGWGSPTTVGAVWIMLQAVVVGAFGAVQLLGLRRRVSPPPAGRSY